MQFEKFCLKIKLFFIDFPLTSLENDNNHKSVIQCSGFCSKYLLTQENCVL